jgi:hypothetical protein
VILLRLTFEYGNKEKRYKVRNSLDSVAVSTKKKKDRIAGYVRMG